MIITRLTINNLGLFLGKHVVKISPQIEKGRFKPITIFGGLNGSGKTTIFDAIKLCLYGPDILFPMNTSKYPEYLKERIHRSDTLLIQPNFASIEIEFEYSNNGEKNTYEVERMWERNERNLYESLSVKRNGLAVDELEGTNWREFTKEFIPSGLSQLFFFDGEKIQKMMYDENNLELKNSIIALLGLDLIERLEADLKIYKKNILKKTSQDTFSTELQILETQKEELEAKIASLNDRLKPVEEKIRKQNSKIEEYKNKIAAQGEAYLKGKETLEQKKTEAEKDIEILKEKIVEMASGLLPVALAQTCAANLKIQLIEEEKYRNERITGELLEQKGKDISRTIDNGKFIEGLEGLKIKDLGLLKKGLKKEIKKLLHYKLQYKSKAEIHGLSQKQTFKVLNDIETAINTVPNKLNQLTEDYEVKYWEAQEVYSNLQKVPDEEFLKVMYEQLNNLNIELGGLAKEKENLTHQLNLLINKNGEIQKNIDNILVKMSESIKVGDTIDLLDRSGKVLSEYHRELTKLKITQLEKEFVHISGKLHHKGDLINKIEINPDTFEVNILDKKNMKVNKNNLSSGELEMYAISMVWALAKISGRKLPFMIDTPLARLDAKHRDNLVKLFFPYASHQMIIFSTDTEVDGEYFKLLEPFISKAYKLEFNNQEKRATIKEGYFWN